jgi:uncharacterized membrane protein (Fun14 family)
MIDVKRIVKFAAIIVGLFVLSLAFVSYRGFCSSAAYPKERLGDSIIE